MYILDLSTTHNWTVPQAWSLIKSLSSSDSIAYNSIVLSDIFKSTGISDSDATLQALETAELISIVSTNGRPYAIKPGKPVYTAAFRYLTRDKVLKARMDLEILNALLKVEAATIEKAEKELELLGNLPKVPKELNGRVGYLLSKVLKSQEKIEKYEGEQGILKKVLSEEY